MLYKQFAVFSGVNLVQTGTKFGEVHPISDRFTSQFKKLQEISGKEIIVAQKLAFNNVVTIISSLTELEVGISQSKVVPGFYRTKTASDGVIVRAGLDFAVCVMNADCSVVQIEAPNGDLAVLHLGLNNIENPDTSIILSAIRTFESLGVNASQLKFRVGEGALNCCYGLKSSDPVQAKLNMEKAERLTHLYGSHVSGQVLKGPRVGGISFNIPLIAAEQAKKLGVNDIQIDQSCSSCYGVNDEDLSSLEKYGSFFSNLREDAAIAKLHGYGPRNAVLVYHKIPTRLVSSR